MSNVKHKTLSEGKVNLQCTTIQSRAETVVTLERDSYEPGRGELKQKLKKGKQHVHCMR